MSKNKTINSKLFGAIPTLSTVRIPGEKFKAWKQGAERSYEPVIQRLIDYNAQQFNFLGIDAKLISEDFRPYLQLTTSQYAGAVPIRSAKNGLPVEDIIVTGRFGENVADLIDLLQDEISPEYFSDLKLIDRSCIEPPIFLECCKFFNSYLEAEKHPWRKFDNITKREQEPGGGTDWTDYARRIVLDPQQSLTFKNRKNIISDNHRERFEINYVLDMALDIFLSPSTPISTRIAYNTKTSYLRHLVSTRVKNKTKSLRIHASDPIAIKSLKRIGNKILEHNTNERIAWRIDYSKFFETYVQYVCKSAAHRKGLSVLCNPRYDVSGSRGIDWIPSYLEPDLIIGSRTQGIIVDAKYKSHLYNLYDLSDKLKETFRYDLHQVMCYASMISAAPEGDSKNRPPRCMLIYPFDDFIVRRISAGYTNIIDVVLAGIPLQRELVDSTITSLSEII